MVTSERVGEGGICISSAENQPVGPLTVQMRHLISLVRGVGVPAYGEDAQVSPSDPRHLLEGKEYNKYIFTMTRKMKIGKICWVIFHILKKIIIIFHTPHHP